MCNWIVVVHQSDCLFYVINLVWSLLCFQVGQSKRPVLVFS